MNRVAVLMSTYNGKKFLCEQLDSILSQTNVEVEIFIRDDGSMDGTKEILDKYAVKEGIHVDYAENVGVGNSFMNLLYSVPSDFDYYAFSDQDDIWMDCKLCEAIEMLRKSGKMLYASNQECVDGDGKSLGLRYEPEKYIHLKPEEIVSRNMISGCTMVFTKEFFKILESENHRPSFALLLNRIHDVWVAAVASLYDAIVYDSRAFIKYRQHENNVVGAYDGGLKKRTKERMKKVMHKQYRNGRSMLAKELCSCFSEISDEYPLLKICAGGKSGILKNRKALRSYTGESAFAFFAKTVLGLF